MLDRCGLTIKRGLSPDDKPSLKGRVSSRQSLGDRREAVLEVLIPTYNRRAEVLKNVRIWEHFILQNQLKDVVAILVSDNASTDDTAAQLYSWVQDAQCRVTAFFQANNIGGAPNCVFLLGQASARFILFCGDDDWIDEAYFLEVISLLRSASPPATILPNFINVSSEGAFISERSPGKPTRRYSAGRWTAATMMWLGHQMSGVVFERTQLFDSYHRHQVENNYPFIYFAGYASQRGDLVHLTAPPVKVTAGAVKYWSYGLDSLLDDALKNYRQLFGRFSVYRFIGEWVCLYQSRFAYRMYLEQGWFMYARHLGAIVSARHISVSGKLLYIGFNVIASARWLAKRLLRSSGPI